MSDNVISLDNAKKKKSKKSEPINEDEEPEKVIIGCPTCFDTLFYIYHDYDEGTDFIACQHCDELIGEIPLTIIEFDPNNIDDD